MNALVGHPTLRAILGGTTLPPVALDTHGWEELVDSAIQQGFAPQLFRQLAKSHSRFTISPSLLERLKQETFHIAAHNILLEQELTTILRHCQRRQIACAPLRGLALAEHLYGKALLRPAGDIDLLVRQGDLPAITALLSGLGYEEMEHQSGFARTFSYTLEFVHRKYGFYVEPHWTLSYPPFIGALDMGNVWSRCHKGRVAGIDTWLLSDEDLLMHLCFHILHKGDNTPLLWWHELDLLIRHPRTALNWDTIIMLAEQAGQSLLVSEVLQTLLDRFHTPIPRATLAHLSAQQSLSPVASLLMNAPGLSGREEFAQFVSLPGFHARLRYAFGLLFPSPAYMRQRYDAQTPARLGICYLGRMLRIGWDGIRWAAALLSITRSAKPSLSR